MTRSKRILNNFRRFSRIMLKSLTQKLRNRLLPVPRRVRLPNRLAKLVFFFQILAKNNRHSTTVKLRASPGFQL